MQTVKVPAWEWYSWKHEEIFFPDNWDVNIQKMNGHATPKLSEDEIRERIQSPIGTSPLSHLARGKRKCCIIFDDMTRATKTYQILPIVLEELRRAGLDKDKIVFVMATGAHDGRPLMDFQKKLGREIPERYLVFNHNCYEHFIDLGVTSNGTRLKVNKEVMSCDLKITISGIIPHFGYGFGGGSKMILPGVSSLETIKSNHRITEGTGPGLVKGNLRRSDSEEAASMVGLDFMVAALLNSNCDTADLVCGDFVEAHRVGVRKAREFYATDVVKNVDIALGNGFPMANEGYKAYHILNDSVRPQGDMVFLVYTPEGARIHNYNGRFGEGYGGAGWSPTKYVKKPWKMDRVICVSPERTKLDECYYGEGSIWVGDWREALDLLEEHGETATIAVYPTAAMQISREKAAKT